MAFKHRLPGRNRKSGKIFCTNTTKVVAERHLNEKHKTLRRWSLINPRIQHRRTRLLIITHIARYDGQAVMERGRRDDEVRL